MEADMGGCGGFGAFGVIGYKVGSMSVKHECIRPLLSDDSSQKQE